MPLEDYKEKRDFKKTPEPVPEEKAGSKGKRRLQFVIHKHYASRLHFDLRLELEGVLKSWAVPKGPTLNPKEKKLAVMVEDHPYDYKDFEGSIPEGNYGAGEVYIWDNGTYNAYGEEDAEKSTEILKAGLEKGHITFIMHGQRLNGEYALVKLKKGEARDWLWIKKNDEFATETEPDFEAPGEKKK